MEHPCEAQTPRYIRLGIDSSRSEEIIDGGPHDAKQGDDWFQKGPRFSDSHCERVAGDDPGVVGQRSIH